MKSKINKSFLKNPRSIIQIYGNKNLTKFRKLLVSRVNQKDKRIKTQIKMTQNTLSASQSLNNSSHKFYDKHITQNPEVAQNQNIKDYVKLMNIKNNTIKNQKGIRVHSPRQKISQFNQGNEIFRNKYAHSVLDKHETTKFEDINTLENQVQEILQKRLDRFRIRTSISPQKNDHRFYLHQDSHLFHKSQSYKQNKLQILPQSDSQNQNKLQTLIYKIRDMQNTNNDQNSIAFNNHKILILEKIMAENSAESEIAKKYYFQAVAEKKKFDKRKFAIPASHKITIPSIKTPQKTINTQSVNQSTYKKPNKQDYDIYRYKHQPFRKNQLPLPKSTYHQQYIGYKDFPNFSYHKLEHSRSVPNDHRQKRSIYSQDFHKKQADRINYKQLDCYKDKLKDLDVSYVKIKQRIDEYPKTNVLSIRQDLEQKRNQRLKDTNNPINKQLLLSQSQRQFKGATTESSVIKHKQLSNLKYSYKNIIHA